MYLYLLLLKLAALFGHRKARLLVKGQAAALDTIARYRETNGLERPVWIHVASVGEFEQIRPIIERMKREHPKQQIVLTFYSPSGYELRKDYDKADLVCYLPHPTRRNARAFLDAVQPKMVLLVKYEYWPAYLNELKRRNIPTYSIASIFRPNQLFFRPWGGWYKRLLGCFTHLYVQDEESLQLLHRAGIDCATVTGDTRFDRVEQIAQQHRQIPTVEAFVGDCQRVIVAGSTWPKDEALLARYIGEHPEVKLILAPHEVNEEHLHYLFELLDGRMVRYTEATQVNVTHCQTLVVDTIGLLSAIYQYGHVAYIGGGFGAGIHNTLEAAVYGMPVLWGPRYKQFREAYGLQLAGAGFPIHDYTSLESELNRSLANCQLFGRKARRYVESELGATERIWGGLKIED